ncbi:hypothetical protein PG989_005221 [Apiospora arundinis]
MASMLEFRTPGFNPYAVKYSPYFDSRIAVASAANYGIVGNGRLFCLGLGPQGIQVEKTFDTNDAQYDLAWSEINENQLLAACGDGSIKLYDVNVPQFPVMNFHEHKRETFSVAWSPVTKDTFASSSWDGTIKIWSPARQESIKTLPVGNCTYSTSYCPSNPNIISAVSTDSHLRIFDLRTPVNAQYHLTTKIPVHAMPAVPLPPRRHAAASDARRDPDARLEQVQRHRHRHGWRRPRHPHLRHPEPLGRPRVADDGPRLRRAPAGLEPTRPRHPHQRQLRHDGAPVDRWIHHGTAAASPVARKPRGPARRHEPAYRVRYRCGLVPVWRRGLGRYGGLGRASIIMGCECSPPRSWITILHIGRKG